MVDPARHVGVRARPHLDAQDAGASVEDPEVVIVGAVAVGPEAMTAVHRHDARHRALAAPHHPVGDAGDRAEPFDREPPDGLGREDQGR